MTPPLHLLHCQPDPQRLTVWAARHRLQGDQGDQGYAVHALLQAAFGEAAPQPFSYQGTSAGLLAYSSRTVEELRERAALAAPDVAAALGLDAGPHSSGLSMRPMPPLWRTGTVLGFEVRLRPILRQQGRERDVFLAAVEQAKAAAPTEAGAPLQRDQIYGDWLATQLLPAASLLDVSMLRFQINGVIRRTQAVEAVQARRTHQISGPDALLGGHLQITDPAAFSALLARGLGRHRAFGFGMLLLRPA